jgi:lipopolysaccharide export system permease protein
MKILDRYIFVEFISTLTFASLSFVSLFVLIDLIEKLDDFIDHDVSYIQIAEYYLYFIPEIIKLTAPISTLLSSLFVTGRLSKQTELSSMKSSGISLYRMLVPFFLVGVIITSIDLYLSGWVVPDFEKQKTTFESAYLGKVNKSSGKNSNIYILDSPTRIVKIRYFNDNANISYNVEVHQFNGSELLWRIDADRMVYDTLNQKWLLKEAVLRDFTDSTEQLYASSVIDSVTFSFTLNELKTSNADLDQMTLDEHSRFIESRRKAGFADMNEALVKYHLKLAFPFSCLIVILIGVPLSAQKKRSGLALEAGLSIMIGFMYIGLQKIFSTLGYKSTLDPVLAAWFPDMFFLGVGLIMLYKAKK